MAEPVRIGFGAERRESLDDLAWRITTQWRQFADRRVSTALLLKQARDRIEAGEDPRFPDFMTWCRKLAGRSKRDIDRLLAFADAPDPEAALNEHRARTAAQTRKWRARRASARSSADSQAAGESAASSDTQQKNESGDDREEVDATAPEQADSLLAIHQRAVAFYRRNRHLLSFEDRREMGQEVLDGLGLTIGDFDEPTRIIH